jgi:hypothetical protein
MTWEISISREAILTYTILLLGKMCRLLGRRSPTIADIGLRIVSFQIEQHTKAKFVLMYPFAHSTTLHHRFLSGNCTLFSSAATNYAMVQYIHFKGPPDSDKSDCVASRLSSWKDTLLVVNQWVLTGCISSLWNSFEMEQVLHGYNCRYLSFWRYRSVDQVVLKSGHIIQCCPEPTQWNIAW